MEQSLLAKILTKMGLAILAVAMVDLIYLNWWIIKNDNLKIKNENIDQTRAIQTEITEPTPVVTPAPSPIGKLDSETRRTVETKTVVQKETQTIVQTANKELFIPMGSGSTTSSTFYDLSGTDVAIDTSKYTAIESVTFEASIWVEGGNGRAYAQLYNVNDKTAYIESQISNNTASGVVKTSGKIPIPSGQKTYRVQAKTDISNFAAHVDNARIKIVLK